jgi:hypothetical protein
MCNISVFFQMNRHASANVETTKKMPTRPQVAQPSPKRQRTDQKSRPDDGFWGEMALLRDFKSKEGCSIPSTHTIGMDHPIKKLLFKTEDQEVQIALLLALREISGLTRY